MRLFAIALLLLANAGPNSAHANQYEIFELSCKLAGTVETLSTQATELKTPLTFKIRLAKLLGTSETIPQSKFIQILDSKGQRMATPAFDAAASATAQYGSEGECASTNASLDLELKPVDPAVAQQFFVEMGAHQLPELARSDSIRDGKVAFEKLTLKTSECNPGNVLDVSNNGTLSQIHFNYTEHNGLSFHMRLEQCTLRYLDPRKPKPNSGRRGD